MERGGMTRVCAIIGATVGGWLVFGLLPGIWQPATAQDLSAPSVVPVEQPAVPPAGEMTGQSLIEHLNHALDKALSGSVGAVTGSGAMPLVASRKARPARGPVVVELFTSQGCSSCPPADEMFARFAARPDVIALSLHVDYWDYLGWEDPFAQPAFTQRQKGYARAAKSRSIYTPQMIVEGRQSLIGGDETALDMMVREEKGRQKAVSISVSGSDGQYQIELSADPPQPQGAIVQIVRYMPAARVEILRGENAGMVVNYANVVTAWHAVAEWDGRTATRFNAKIEGDDPAVVIVQSAVPGKSAPLPGPILAAERLN
ncbi:DUF1223 domain-containing protein [Sinirhodobacter populi]|uniref:DUF1223 domain-containing protein n=2 Tax=Paenirhodobacter populi TaxID=2306993 RepID=A0A451GCE3_9RHOB|nr:DUF1223 domain-containing protein [Sinirhodobacter populi]RWR20860.1 DUF1223 domain-containing protein [Sinirhodobacter populi]RWR29693.1 DUF1223 domain-containing protein [Sinirhodobacter populi]